MSNTINNKHQEVVTFSIEENMVKYKAMSILIDPKEFNAIIVKDLSIFKPNVLIFWDNKEKYTMPFFYDDASDEGSYSGEISRFVAFTTRIRWIINIEFPIANAPIMIMCL